MPEEEIKVSEKKEIKKPESKKGLPIKLILLGSAGYLVVLGLMIAGMILVLKPDAPPLEEVASTAESAPSVAQPSVKEPDVSDPATTFLDFAENVDITDLVDELKEIEYKGRLRQRMEADSVARLQAENETRIAKAKLEKLKLETAKLIAARYKPGFDAGSAAYQEAAGIFETPPDKMEKSGSKKGYQHLAKIYASMRPAEAAKILDKMETNLVVNLLANMKNRNAAKILSSFKPQKAARISREMSTKLAQI